MAYITKSIHGSQLNTSPGRSANVTEIKKQQLELWLAERQYDINGLSRDSSFRQELQHYLEQGTHITQVQNRLAALITEHSFHSVLLLDPKGKQRLLLGSPLSKFLMSGLPDKTRLRPATQCDHSNMDGYCQLSWFIPLAIGQQIYQLVFVVDTSLYLFPSYSKLACVQSDR